MTIFKFRDAVHSAFSRQRPDTPAPLEDAVPDDLHNMNPLAPAKLTIQIETDQGPRTVLTSAIPRHIASSIVDALAAKSIMACVTDDLGVHTVAELVRRKRLKEKRKAPAAIQNNITALPKRSHRP